MRNNGDYAAGSVSQVTGLTITATNIINNGTRIIYTSPQSIILNPGFMANSGSVFSAITGTCN